MTISHAIDPYLAVQAAKRKSVKTRSKYQWFLGKLADMYPHADVAEITFEQLLAFFAKWGGAQDSTLAQRISVVKMFFRWLVVEGHIAVDPAARLERPRLKDAAENDRVTTITGDEVRRMFEVSQGWTEVLLLNLLAYTGARRHAIAQVRRRDYDAGRGTITYLEKGSKTITKRVALELARVLDAAIAGGLYETPDDYLVPSRATIRRGDGVRHDAFVWDVIKEIGERAGIPDVHVHAFRAAFAVEFLKREKEQGRDGLLALKDLLGHSRIETTMIYLRKMERADNMDRVVDFSWGNGPSNHPSEPREPSAPGTGNHSQNSVLGSTMLEPIKRVLPPEQHRQPEPLEQPPSEGNGGRVAEPDGVFDLFDLLRDQSLGQLGNPRDGLATVAGARSHQHREQPRSKPGSSGPGAQPARSKVRRLQQ